MKKLFCILLVVMLVLPVFSNAENVVSEYSRLLNGKWNSAGYSGVPSGSNHSCKYLDYFIYPGTNQATITSSYSEKLNTETTTVLVGDETGEVYLCVSESYLKYITVGRVMFSENGRVMMLLCADGSTFIFVKE